MNKKYSKKRVKGKRSKISIKFNNTSKILIFLAFFCIVASMIFFSPHMTGKATYSDGNNQNIGLANLNPDMTNTIGIIFLIIALIAAIVWFIKDLK